MAIWFCRECKRAFHQEAMLPGWNGLWCPNCVWNEVVPATAAEGATVSSSLELRAPDAVPPGARP